MSKSYECKEPECQGKIVNGLCQVCGSESLAPTSITQGSAASPPAANTVAAAQPTAATGDLLRTSQKLEALVPDDYQAWRMQADLFLAAIRQLQTREIESDEAVKLMHVPLRESALRDAAEEALRNCAHFAQTFEERVALIDEANRIRRTTWF